MPAGERAFPDELGIFPSRRRSLWLFDWAPPRGLARAVPCCVARGIARGLS